MKDYSMNEEERDNFVLNYDIENNNIIVNYASDRKAIIPYTEDNERKVLDKMKFQFENVDEARDYAVKKLRYHTIDLIFLVPFIEFLYIIISGLTTGATSLADLTINQIIFSISVTALPGLMVGRGISKIIFYNKKILDIAKNRMFQENEFDMNMYMKVNDDYLKKVSKETEDLIKSIPEDKPIFTYNTIDRMTPMDVATIICNIEENDNIDMNPKTRMRKK